MKLLHKTVFVIISSAVFGVMAVSFLSYSYVKAALEESIIKDQYQITSQTLNQIDRLMYNSMLQIQSVSQEDLLEEILIAPNMDGLPHVHKRLDELALTSGPWDVLSIITKEGTILASTSKRDVSKNINAFPGALAAFDGSKEGALYFSDVTISKMTGKPNVFFSSPVRNYQSAKNEITGVIIGQLSWLTVSEIINDLRGLDVTLYNNKGLLIATNNDKNKEKIFNFDASENQYLKTLRESKTGKTGSDVLPTSTAQGDSVLSTYIEENGYLSYKGSGWVLGIEVPGSTAYATAQSTALRLSFILGLLLLLMSIPTIIIIYNFSRPIIDFTNSVNEMVVGTVYKKIHIRSHDEISMLASAFNMLIDKLHSSNTELAESLHTLKLKNEELDLKIQETEKLNKLMIGRELKMTEMKEQIKQLEEGRAN